LITPLPTGALKRHRTTDSVDLHYRPSTTVE